MTLVLFTDSLLEWLQISWLGHFYSNAQPDLPLSGGWYLLLAEPVPSRSQCGQRRRPPWGGWCHAGWRRDRWTVRPLLCQRERGVLEKRPQRCQLYPEQIQVQNFLQWSKCLMNNLITQSGWEKAKWQMLRLEFSIYEFTYFHYFQKQSPSEP